MKKGILWNSCALLFAIWLCQLYSCKKAPSNKPPKTKSRKVLKQKKPLRTRVPTIRKAKKKKPLAKSSRKKWHWHTLQKGVEYAVLDLKKEVQMGTGQIHFVRIQNLHKGLTSSAASEFGQKKQTARQWAKDRGYSIVVNAGMFKKDHSSNVGYFRKGKHINSKTWNAKYLSVLTISNSRFHLPTTRRLKPHEYPGGRIFDLQSPGRGSSQRYARKFKKFWTVIQNLRLIKSQGKRIKKGVGVWSKRTKNRKWSEVALAMDKYGNLLFVFSRSPFSMWAFNKLLLSLPLDIIRAMHLEGGPEASLSIHTKKLTLDLSGSYETNFNENDNNKEQWPIPNVLGVLAPHSP